jgi:hypothetical protein
MADGDDAGGIFCYRLGTDYRDNTLDGLVIFAPGPIVGEVGYSEREHFEVRSLTTSGALLSNPIGGPDVTGDGLGDVALMGGEAGVFLFPGFELPWGDPAAW